MSAIAFNIERSQPSVTEKVSFEFFYRINYFLSKGNILHKLISLLNSKLKSIVYKQWDKIEKMLPVDLAFIESISVEDAISLKKQIQKMIDHNIDANSHFSDLSFSDDEYKKRYKAIQKCLNDVNDKLHFRITRGLPKIKSSDNLKEGLSTLGMKSISESLNSRNAVQ